MNINNNMLTKQVISSGFKLMLVFIILAAPVFGEEAAKKVKKGLYVVERAETPEYVVTGVALSTLSKARFAGMNKVDAKVKGKWGRCFTLFQKKDKKQVKITAAVYGSVAEAEDSALDLLNDTSAVMTPGSKSGGVIGTHSWYVVSASGSGTVVFTYNNSLFQLFSSDYDLAEQSARSIVEDLTAGRNGVRLGKKVVLPKITDVSLPAKLRKGQEIPVVFKGMDPDQQELTFVTSAGKGQLFETEKRGEKKFLPFKEGPDELEIYAVNEMNVVSQVYIKKVEIAKQD